MGRIEIGKLCFVTGTQFLCQVDAENEVTALLYMMYIHVHTSTRQLMGSASIQVNEILK